MVSFLSSTLIYSFPVCPHKVKMLSVADSMNTAVTGLQLVLVSIFQMVKNIAVVMKSFFFKFSTIHKLGSCRRYLHVLNL